MWNNDFINFFNDIVEPKNNKNENETFKLTNQQLMTNCVNEINDIADYYITKGIKIISVEQGKNNKLKCNFKIIKA